MSGYTEFLEHTELAHAETVAAPRGHHRRPRATVSKSPSSRGTRSSSSPMRQHRRWAAPHHRGDLRAVPRSPHEHCGRTHLPLPGLHLRLPARAEVRRSLRRLRRAHGPRPQGGHRSGRHPHPPAPQEHDRRARVRRVQRAAPAPLAGRSRGEQSPRRAVRAPRRGRTRRLGSRPALRRVSLNTRQLRRSPPLWGFTTTRLVVVSIRCFATSGKHYEFSVACRL